MYILIARRIWKTKRAIQPFLKRFSKGVNRNEARTQILRSVTEHFSDFKSSIHSRLGRACHRKSKVQSTTNRANASTSGEENRINAIELTRKQENDSCDGESNTAVPIHFICDPNPSAKTIPPQVKNEEIDVSEVFQSKVSDYNDTTETVSTRTQISKLSRKEARTQIFKSVIGHFSEFKSRIYSSLGKAFHCKSRSASSRTNTSTSDEQNRMNAIEMSMNQENDSCDGESKTVVGINFICDPNHSEKTIPPSVNEENDVSEVFQSRKSDYNDTMETASTRTQINRLSREQTTSTKSVKKHSRKVTAVSCAITFVFIISYVPYFVVVWASVEGRRDVHMTPTEEALYRICGLSYIINNAANSFVYYLMDNDFRTKCKQCICRCFMKP